MCWICGPDKGAVYVYAYIIQKTHCIYITELQLTRTRGRNKCSYTHQHWKPLQPLCSCSGYGPGYRLANLLHFVVQSSPSCKIPRLPLTLSNLGDSNSFSFVSTLVLPQFYARVNIHTHTHTYTHTHTHTHTLGTCSARVNRAQQPFVQKQFAAPLWLTRMQLALSTRSLDVHWSASSCRLTDSLCRTLTSDSDSRRISRIWL